MVAWKILRGTGLVVFFWRNELGVFADHGLGLREFDGIEESLDMQRALGIGSLSMSFAPAPKMVRKEPKSKSNDGSKDTKKERKSKEGLKKVKAETNAKSGGGKQGEKLAKSDGKSESTKSGKHEKRHRILGIGYTEEATKEGKTKSGDKKQKKTATRDVNKLSKSPVSGKEGYYANRKIGTLSPTSLKGTGSKSSGGSSEKSASTLSKSGSKSSGVKLPTPSPTVPKKSLPPKTSEKGTLRRLGIGFEEEPSKNAKKSSSFQKLAKGTKSKDTVKQWKSDRRLVGSGCTYLMSGKTTNVSGSKDGGKSGSKTGSKDRAKSKEGSKSGRTGIHRRMEIGVFDCHFRGSFTCCKEWGDTGDDPLCCKGNLVTDSKSADEKSSSSGDESKDDIGPVVSLQPIKGFQSEEEDLPSPSNDFEDARGFI